MNNAELVTAAGSLHTGNTFQCLLQREIVCSAHAWVRLMSKMAGGNFLALMNERKCCNDSYTKQTAFNT